MSKLTIFTPTYNREKNLQALYDSLRSQTNRDFLWMLVDDGSTDETRKQVMGWAQKQEIQIEYIYQNNQGKHIAMRTAFQHCSTDWIICVDSDDRLTPLAVEEILQDIDQADLNCIGYIYPQKLNSQSFCFPENAAEISIMDAKNIYGVPETAIVFRTKYLQSVEIPQFQGEKFLSEEVIYMQLDRFGKFQAKNKLFYVSEYQPDGLTANLFRLWKKCPEGTMRLLNDRYSYSRKYPSNIAVKQRIYAILNINGLCIATNRSVRKYSPNKLLSLALYLPGLLWSKIRFGK